ncbi:Cis-2,3-dihydrobiphenyl-2,3-diol dehydrogenase [Roseovarius albus]|uniref:Cis-2,3-dihydrobiphenyl-2,3-diol dehydrogenase n=1 Tax=Roseovarius albus TaxID=1247867 RepID=A0A1X6ZKK2_9RHOB|nr:SDR family oxidoreductase [Roseovarius albus]SLN53495.1 Cis-2,3-dihydrobiphenyl-2,3-diol dehydrogenase [Roseovarius albus]
MKSILITGASSGIGLATAQVFLADGWKVGLLARRAEKLSEVATHHSNAIALPADVTNPAAMKQAFADFIAEAGRLDVLFNNAGMFGPAAPIDEVPLEHFDQVVSVNLRGMFIAAQLAFAQMRKQSPQGGRIINNGSISAYVPREHSICYTTTKHAITGITKTLSLDGRPYDIACGQIDIGNAESELVASLKERQPGMHTMPVEDAARSVLHMANLPPEANVQFMTVMATKMPYIGRG